MSRENQKSKCLFEFMNQIDRKSIEYKELEKERLKALSAQQYEVDSSQDYSHRGSEALTQVEDESTAPSFQLTQKALQKLLTASLFTEDLMMKAVNHIRSISVQLKDIQNLTNESFELDGVLRSVKESYQRRELQEIPVDVVEDLDSTYQNKNARGLHYRVNRLPERLDRDTAQLIFEV